ncbi:molybdate ABC transporter permease subunit [Shouchella clausii]|uniref:molybdate ABC transporter permease subunit n=1 Tax=Shouchella clausii TaxID=79880 RepID=UPI000B95DC5A|nr:molybdate ABC transporter permease subunit [Shouchella clausii]AST96414.1 molybdenum ABC transporter permease subunit [Shouchella clausii]MCR1287602.1 molybdate ABC transporter permease subunit [Shouchella clausii]MEB5471351.1 molybdate ABC transporter permease subunit [Shouchella clausii]PAD94269.1 molybdate ABC transporter permease subunit [Shouchella clausii]QNM42771.1 molybdate ABC transporter permease subunit [Shouchella clausii]
MAAEAFWTPIFVSVRVVLVAGALAFVAALVAAAFLKKRRFPGKLALETALMLPLVLPPTVIGFSLLVLFGRRSFIGAWFESLFSQPIVFTYLAAVIAAAVVAFPLIYQTFVNGFEAVDSDLEEAARQMGASEWQVFWNVTFPLSSKTVVSGGMLGLARALGEFGATMMFAGSIEGVTRTIPTSIYIATESGNMVFAFYWVASIIVFAFCLLAAVQRLKAKS